jgi:hypothetical protein
MIQRLRLPALIKLVPVEQLGLSTVRCLGIEIDDAIEIAEKIEV